MKESEVQVGTVVELPRGGRIVQTPIGGIQVGAPPETIKDTLVTPESVPRFFVLPHELFHWQKGINVGDMEFPIYFNFFIRKQKVTICCTEEQGARLSVAIRESVFGPEKLDLRQDLFSDDLNAWVPDISRELSFFRGSLALEDLFDIVCFKDDVVEIDGVHIRRTADSFQFSWDGQEAVPVPAAVSYTPQYDIGERLPTPFVPPRFGVTCLGPSHGFDPHDNTSGFIIWLNHSGIMVDPPVNCTEWLLQSNVNPKFIDSIILTHCHADHDAGTFQKILQEGRVTVYTTPTIMQGFLRKYASFSGEHPDFLKSLFDFHPVYIDQSFYVHGGEFTVYYSVHSIPTMAFRLTFQDKSFVYSSDHQNDPDIHESMRAGGTIDQRRYEQLKSFPWDADVIYHEAGIAPLHTPVTYLASLPEDVQRRITCFHIAEKDFPTDSLLSRASFGIENTRYLDTAPPQYEEAYRVLDVLKQLDFARDLSVPKVQQFFGIVERQTFRAGEHIIRKGSRGNYFYIIMNGNAAVLVDNLVRGKALGAYDYFGEVALMTDSDRTADVVAESEVEVLSIERSRFLNFIAGTEFETVLRRLIRNRSEETWNLLAEGLPFVHLTDYQRMWLESVLQPREYEASEVLIEHGAAVQEVFLVRDGRLRVEDEGGKTNTLQRGMLAGSMGDLHRQQPSTLRVTSETKVSVFAIAFEDVKGFLDRNPGAVMRVNDGTQPLPESDSVSSPGGSADDLRRARASARAEAIARYAAPPAAGP
ncbi:MAG: cAMP/cGMP-dependent 3',5'-cyclic-AMP/GMP phosphodiesterase [Spirochaetaceae bacterium]|nr:MAG: cAMP/cGMP-dependent 3',5'-cyclic-AMP/GMP phosphodiesterase [Spirochaetaceae bacterium]